MRETNPDTLKFLNDQVERGDYTVAYKTFLEIQNPDGSVSLYPPMASKQTNADGKRKMANSMAVNEWEKSVGNPNSKNIIEKNGKWYYRLVKDNGKTVDAAYDPYQHSSNVVLNDQFEEAYQRPNLVTYEVIIPNSELTAGDRYSAVRDDGRVVEAALPVGEHPWKKGTVAGKLKNTDRTVYMTRWLMPSRRLDNSEVAQMYKDILAKEDSSVPVPFNVVPPGLLTELEKIGVPIDYEGSPMYKAAQKRRAEKAVIPAKDSGASMSSRGAFAYNPIREAYAKKGLDEVSISLGPKFPLSAQFDATMSADEAPLVKEDVTSGSEMRQPGESYFKAGRRIFQREYGVLTDVDIPEAGIVAKLPQQIVNESMDKTSSADERQRILDLIPQYKKILSNSQLLGIERIGDLKTGGKGSALFGYRLYNVYNNIDGDTVAPRLVVSTVVQNTEDAVGYILRDIEIVPISQGLSGTMTGASQPTNRNINTVAELYDFVKALPRSDGGLLYTDAQRAEYSFPYTERNDGVAYSSRNANKLDNLKDDLLNIIMNGTAEDVSRYVTEQMNANEDKLENSKMRPPVIPSKGFVPRVTPREKEALETRRKGLIQAKGAMRPSEKSNGFAMPKQDEKGNWFHRFLQNAGSSKELQVAQDQVEKFAFTDVAGTYVPSSNKADLDWAKKAISEDGMESAIKQFNRAAVAMDNSRTDITKNLALGQQLLIETSRQGDMQNFLDVLSSLTLLSSQAGKSLQAFRMLKKSGPIGELYYVQKAVKQLNERNADKITAGKMQTITVPEDLANEVLMATNEEEQDKAMDNLIAEIAKQVPVSLMDKWNAWRYLAMLGNARTHIRNIIGNAVFVPLRFAKDFMAAGGELLATKVGLMNEEDRRKALFVPKELRDFAKQDALAMQKELQGTGKYNPAREILDARRILPGFLETLSRKNGDLLELEDWWFLSPAYQNALAQALTHTGYSIDEMLDGSNQEAVRALNEARRIAIEEAQRATYRDFNAAASMLNRLKRMESGKPFDRFAGMLIEGILPFTKTPINILRRGVEYSPIGIASSIFEAAAGVKNGNLDVAQFIDHLSAGLSGTAVAVLGYLLASLGYIRNKKDDKEEEFDKLQGYQDYSIQIGDVSATIDWAAPTALPLFTGAAAYDMIQRDESLEWKDAWDAMMMIAEPMMSLSMLDGLNNVLSAASYADDSDKLATTMSSAFTSYIGQAFPTLLGQLARSIDGTRRSTYVDKNSPVPSAIQRFVQSSVQSKTPVWESQKVPYIDQWGREDTVKSKAAGALENFFSPSYINIVHTTDVDEALQELYDSTKDSSVLPSTAAKYFSVAGERKDLTADEYVSYAKDVGSTKYQLLTSLFADPRYMSLTDAQKAEAVSVIYKYATAAGKYHVDQNYDLHAQGKWIEEAEAAATDVQRFNRIWEYLEEHFKK